MYKVKSTSLDFGKTDRSPIDLLIANGCEFESLQIDANSEEQGIAYKSKEEILRAADFITLHLPLDGGTRGFIGEADLNAMKKTAVLVNTSRGGVVDEKALYHALKEGLIAGAALDVFEQEPPGNTPLVDLDNFIGCPHIGGVTVEAINRIGMTVARDIVAVLKGEKPEFPANSQWLAS